MGYSSNKSKGGFSLVEIITILFVVSLGLVGIMSLIVQNIQSQNYNKNNLIAYQLAQEGIELMRKVRDTHWLGGTPNSMFDSVLTSNGYYMDYRNEVPKPHDPSKPQELILKQDSYGFYFHDNLSNPDPTATASIFSRLIMLEKIDSNSVKVTSRVTWSENNRNYSYDLETLLYDWY